MKTGSLMKQTTNIFHTGKAQMPQVETAFYHHEALYQKGKSQKTITAYFSAKLTKFFPNLLPPRNKNENRNIVMCGEGKR